MKHLNKLIIGTAASIFVTILALLSFTSAHANPSFFPKVVTTGTGSDATTTATWIAAGLGTTTVTYNSYANVNSASLKTDSALVMFNFLSTSTQAVPKINVRAEYSYNNVDWYPQSAALNTSATTTLMTGNFTDQQFSISTSTANIAGTDLYSSATTSAFRSFAVSNFPTQYVRFVFYVPQGAAGGNLWVGVQPSKQNQ